MTSETGRVVQKAPCPRNRGRVGGYSVALVRHSRTLTDMGLVMEPRSVLRAAQRGARYVSGNGHLVREVGERVLHKYEDRVIAWQREQRLSEPIRLRAGWCWW